MPEKWEVEFNEKFEHQLHEMVDGDWCPALGFFHSNTFERSSVGEVKPNYSITNFSGKCECGGEQKMLLLKSFIKSMRDDIYKKVEGLRRKPSKQYVEAHFIMSERNGYNQALDDVLKAIKEGM